MVKKKKSKLSREARANLILLSGAEDVLQSRVGQVPNFIYLIKLSSKGRISEKIRARTCEFYKMSHNF